MPQPYPNLSSRLADELSMISFEDPAFSTDPNLHPDQQQLGLEPLSYNRPPPYEVLVSPRTPFSDQTVTSNIRVDVDLGRSISSTKVDNDMERDNIYGNAVVSSPESLTPSDSQDLRLSYTSDTDQEELLSYLREDYHESNHQDTSTRNIPSSLIPGRGSEKRFGDVSSPKDQDERMLNSGNLNRSLSLPGPAQRSISAPPAPTGNTSTRPLIPGRSNTTSFRQRVQQSELDRVDELDETSPTGYHHRGPYEVTGKVDTPPSRMLPLPSEQSVAARRVMVEDNSFAVAPAPVPFRINLKPGEFLTRVQPYPTQQPWTGAYEQRRPPFGPSRYPVEVIPRHANVPTEKSVGNRQWSPEQLYENAVDVNITGILGDSVNTMPGYNRREDDPRQHRPSPAPDGRRQSVRFEDEQVTPGIRSPQRQRIIEESVGPRPPPLASSNASIHSDVSYGSRSFAPSSIDRFRPKKIVMPAPLQFQSRSQENLPRHALTPSRSEPSLQRAATIQPTAAQIPMHDQKRGNLLKKRASIKPLQKHRPNQENAGPLIASEPVFSTAGPIGRQEEKPPKASRKLSKRRS